VRLLKRNREFFQNWSEDRAQGTALAYHKTVDHPTASASVYRIQMYPNIDVEIQARFRVVIMRTVTETLPPGLPLLINII